MGNNKELWYNLLQNDAKELNLNELKLLSTIAGILKRNKYDLKKLNDLFFTIRKWIITNTKDGENGTLG